MLFINNGEETIKIICPLMICKALFRTNIGPWMILAWSPPDLKVEEESNIVSVSSSY